MATNRRSAAARARASAAAGSASAILVATRDSNRPQGSASRYSVVCSSTQSAWSRSRPAAAHIWATWRACQTRPRPAVSRAHSRGWRCRTLSASRIRWSAATCPMPWSAPSSAAANSATVGVPCAPTWLARSIPGRTRIPARRRCSLNAAPECRSAQCAASTNSSPSTRSRWACRSATTAQAVSASRSSIQSVSSMHRTYVRTPTLPATGPYRHKSSIPDVRGALVRSGEVDPRRFLGDLPELAREHGVARRP